jgi:soluble lytic murein transglycosylase
MRLPSRLEDERKSCVIPCLLFRQSPNFGEVLMKDGISCINPRPYGLDHRQRQSPPLKAAIFILALLLVALARLPDTHGFDLQGNRDDFLAAEAALKRGDRGEFELLAGLLEDYPLYPYLRYAQLARDLGSADAESIAEFLTDFVDTPQAGRLRRAWLKQLAKAGRWEMYVRFYVPDDSILRRCHYLRGLLQSGQLEAALDQVEPLWLTGKSLPEACDPLLEAWKQAGRLTDKLIWQRIALAMDAGEIRLAGYLGRSLPEGERIWVERWRSIHRDPRQVVNIDSSTEPHPYRTQILAHGITRLAAKEPNLAADTWERLSRELDFPADQAQRANAAVGFVLAEDGDRRGLSYLDRIPAREENLDLQERRLRAALKHRDWDRVAEWIAAMPEGRRKTEHWLYWQARAEDLRGDAGAAQKLFAAAAAERSLWGFLAAERVGRPYKLGGGSTPADPQRVACIEQSAAVARIRQLEALGRELDVAREWYWLTHDMDREDLMAAAVIAQRRGWPDRAIFTLAKSGYWDELRLRFPLLHLDRVREQALANGLDESWIYAVLRQESAFNPKAISGSGAIGLMQLMPSTAREVAQSLGLPPPARSRLFEPRLNIALGSSYLAHMQRRFGGNPVLATAAYNAGPARVDRWLPEHAIDADLWIATIPFRETRGYVRRVLAYRLIYDQRLGVPIKPLHDIMGRIGKKAAIGGEGDAHGELGKG